MLESVKIEAGVFVESSEMSRGDVDDKTALRVSRAETRLTVYRTSYILEQLQLVEIFRGQRQSVVFVEK